jgi:transcriptional regulator with GAF, ATPase, and Fis domain
MNVPDADGVASPSAAPNPPLPVTLSRVTDDDNLVASLQRVAVAGRDLLATCTSASVTLIAAGRPVTMAATDAVAVDLDHAQYAVDDGPCLTAAREQRLIHIDDMGHDDRWPHFGHSAQTHDVAASMSVPLLMAEADTFGALNIYGAVTGGFTRQDEELAERFAEQAAIVVANVAAYWTALDSSVNMAAAMEHRGVIEQAKGILMAAHRCSPDEAFTLLRQRSQAANRKLRDIAIEIVADVQRDEA